MVDVKIEQSWKHRLNGEFQQPYFKQLTDFVRNEYRQYRVYPPGPLIFNAFNLCPFDSVKVVIIGQDPYHEPGQAQGLAFSVPDGVRIPPSLVNIYKEIKDDTGNDIPLSGDLTRWVRQGVFLLNATLTVREHQAGSHQRQGWERFTDAVIKVVSDEKEHVAFILWGSYAQSKMQLINQSKHLVLRSTHPSPLSAHRGFFGNHHFSLANQFLQQHGMQPIQW